MTIFVFLRKGHVVGGSVTVATVLTMHPDFYFRLRSASLWLAIGWFFNTWLERLHDTESVVSLYPLSISCHILCKDLSRNNYKIEKSTTEDKEIWIAFEVQEEGETIIIGGFRAPPAPSALPWTKIFPISCCLSEIFQRRISYVDARSASSNGLVPFLRMILDPPLITSRIAAVTPKWMYLWYNSMQCYKWVKFAHIKNCTWIMGANDYQ